MMGRFFLKLKPRASRTSSRDREFITCRTAAGTKLHAISLQGATGFTGFAVRRWQRDKLSFMSGSTRLRGWEFLHGGTGLRGFAVGGWERDKLSFMSGSTRLRGWEFWHACRRRRTN